MSKIIIYLLIGMTWDIIYTFISNIIESKNILNNKERFLSILIWPIIFIIFGYHFIKSLLNQRN